jgi:glyoxylate reductase
MCTSALLPLCVIVSFPLEHLVSESRSHFLTSFRSNGLYEGTAALYRRNASKAIGKIDAPLIHALADTSVVC